MIPEYFALLSTAIASTGGLYYLYLTIKGKVQPHKITYFFWGLFPLIIFLAQWDQGVGPIVWVTFISSFIPFLILISASLNRAAHWKIKSRDYGYAAVAVFAMFLWYVTKDPNVALILALIADFAVGLPTVIKAYHHPESENWHAYALNAFGFAVGLMSIQIWVFESYAFVFYLFLVSTTIAFLASRKKTMTR